MSGAKKLAFLLPNLRGGGAERVALRLIEDFVAAGHEVELVLLERTGELLELLPPQVKIVNLGAARIREGSLPLIRYLRETRPHAMQVSMWPLTILGIAARDLASPATRVLVSDHVTLSKQYSGLGRIGALVQRWGIRLFYPRAEARVVVSTVAADDLARLSGIDRDSIQVVYNPVASPPREEGAADVETIWGGQGSRIITVGSLKAQKNHRLLIKAFALLVARRPARLVILGEGELRDELEALAADRGVADLVSFPGFALDPWPYYRSADLFVLSSDYEGYPLVLIEAMRAGLPVVSTDCESGPSEILDGGCYGMLVPCGDAEALAEAMASALDAPADPDVIRARAEALSGQDTSDRYLELMLGEGA